jgi:erythromycin esterase
MKIIERLITVVLSILLIGTFAGCSKESDIPDYTLLQPYITDVEEAKLPNSGIIALGEATHGNKDFTVLKLEVFRQLVEQSDIRAFALEGDFGGCQKVNQYIQTGEGSAAEAAAEIGFAIYRTEEMAALLDWMREYNTGKQEKDQIRFYGYDMQRYDNNKEELIVLLEQVLPKLAVEYEDVLSGISDDTMFDLDKSTVEKAIPQLEVLDGKLESQKDTIVAAIGEQKYDMCRALSACLLQNTRLRTANNYGTLRDSYMAEHVAWIYEYEMKYFGAEGIFITGHNGHIGKSTATVGTKKSMGQILNERFGETYYAVGTEFGSSRFLAPDSSGERREFSIENKGDGRLAVLLAQSETASLFLDLDAAAHDNTLFSYLERPQSMSSIGEYFSDIHSLSEKGYTQRLSPLKSYNALIYVRAASPSTMLE